MSQWIVKLVPKHVHIKSLPVMVVVVEAETPNEARYKTLARDSSFSELYRRPDVQPLVLDKLYLL